ncbi:MAG: hypothetical protein KAG96_06520 [Ichthyobacteriaceae bacterium]|nr:hypothetical protein [Ichthyobacteriaceae bacterium]
MKKILPIIILLLGLLPTANSQNMGLFFDGDKNYVDCGNDPSLHIEGGEITVEAWIYPTEFKAETYSHTIVANEDDNGPTESFGYVFRFGAEGILSFAYGTGIVWEQCTLTPKNTLKLNTWQHVAVTYNKENTEVNFYVNGIKAATKVDLDGTDIVKSELSFSIGKTKYDNRSFKGIMDEVRVWDVTRSAAEIRSNIYKELTGNETGLAAYYKFNETSGSTLKDSQSLSRNNGTLTDMSETWVPSAAFYGPKNAIALNGSGNITIPSNLGLGANNITAECWVYLPSTNELGLFLHTGNYHTGYGIGVSNNDASALGNKLVVLVDDKRFVSSGVDIGTGWHHVAFTIDTNNRVSFYLDGINVFTETSTQAIAIAPTNFASIGGFPNSAEFRLSNGYIDEVRFWNSAIPASQIRLNMNNNLIGNEPGLVGYYNLDILPINKTPNIAENNLNISDGEYNGSAVIVSSSAFSTQLNTNNTSINTASNWSLGTIPNSSTNITISNLTESVTAKHLVIRNSSTIGTSIIINASGNFFNLDPTTTVNGKINANNIVNDNTLNISNGVTIDATNNIINNGTLNVNTGATINATNNIINNGTLNVK